MKSVLKVSVLVLVLLVTSSLVLASQTVGVTLTATAKIPTFIRFSLSSGDQGWSGMITPGTGAPGVVTSDAPNLLFEHINGFVNADWNKVDNPQPDAGTYYIQAKNNLKATIVSNTTYEYIVNAPHLSPLDHDSLDTLPMEQSVKINNSKFSEAEALNGSDVKVIAAGTRGTTTVEHRFRVPYSIDYLAGTYSGTITFKVVSL